MSEILLIISNEQPGAFKTEMKCCYIITQLRKGEETDDKLLWKGSLVC